jgi:hypothetical protein
MNGRREFITLLGGAHAGAANAGDRLSQQRLTGIRRFSSRRGSPRLKEVGYWEERNVTIESRWPRVRMKKKPRCEAGSEVGRKRGARPMRCCPARL